MPFVDEADVSGVTDAGKAFCQSFVESANVEFFVHADGLPQSAPLSPGWGEHL